MNSRERVLAALRCEQPDRVPVGDLEIDEPILSQAAKVLGYKSQRADDESIPLYDPTQRTLEDLERYCFVIEQLGLDFSSTYPTTGAGSPDEQGMLRDKFDRIYRRAEHGYPMVVEGPIKSLDDLNGYDMLSRLEPGDLEQPRFMVERLGSEKAHFIAIDDPFDLSWQLRGGMQHLLLDFRLESKLVHRLMRMTTDYDLGIIEMAVHLGIELDGIMLCGDIADERSTLMSPGQYREFLKPYQQELVEECHRQGWVAVKHSDGNMRPFLDDLLEIGFDGYHPVQPQCMDIEQTKEYVAGKMCLVGNIDCRFLLPYGTEEEVAEAVRDTIAKAAPGGGYILTSSNSIHPNVKMENFMAMVRAAKEYGSYQ